METTICRVILCLSSGVFKTFITIIFVWCVLQCSRIPSLLVRARSSDMLCESERKRVR